MRAPRTESAPGQADMSPKSPSLTRVFKQEHPRPKGREAGRSHEVRWEVAELPPLLDDLLAPTLVKCTGSIARPPVLLLSPSWETSVRLCAMSLHLRFFTYKTEIITIYTSQGWCHESRS